MKGGDREKEEQKERERNEVEDRHGVRAQTGAITPIANWPFSV